MAPRPPGPVFLPPERYRQKRLLDAARLLPVLGAALFLVPILWGSPDPAPRVSNAAALLYVFAVWAGLILAAFLLSRALRPEEEEPSARPGEDDAR